MLYLVLPFLSPLHTLDHEVFKFRLGSQLADIHGVEPQPLIALDDLSIQLQQLLYSGQLIQVPKDRLCCRRFLDDVVDKPMLQGFVSCDFLVEQQHFEGELGAEDLRETY